MYHHCLIALGAALCKLSPWMNSNHCFKYIDNTPVIIQKGTYPKRATGQWHEPLQGLHFMFLFFTVYVQQQSTTAPGVTWHILSYTNLAHKACLQADISWGKFVFHRLSKVPLLCLSQWNHVMLLGSFCISTLWKCFRILLMMFFFSPWAHLQGSGSSLIFSISRATAPLCLLTNTLYHLKYVILK